MSFFSYISLFFFYLHYFKVSRSSQAYFFLFFYFFFNSDFFLLYFKIFISSSAIFNLFCFVFFSSHTYIMLSTTVLSMQSCLISSFGEMSVRQMMIQWWFFLICLRNSHTIIHRTIFLVTVVNIFTKLCSLNSSRSFREGPSVYH